MNKFINRQVVFVLIAALLLTPTAALAADDFSVDDVSVGSITMDVLICRPAGIVAVGIGAALWTVGLPFSALGRNIGGTAKILILEPVKFTFFRPLGNFRD